MKLEHPIPVPDRHVLETRQGAMIVLWTIREHGPLSFATLCRLLGGEDRIGGTALGVIENTLSELAAAGLIAYQGIDDPADPRPVGRQSSDSADAGSYKVTEAVKAMQRLFGISVESLARNGFDQIAVDPVFGPIVTGRRTRWPEAFVLMPFAEELRPVYEDHILKVAEGLGIRCQRADDFFTSGAVIADVWSAIYRAKVCIADCTGRNPNVFYEMGIAHTLGRPCILMAQSEADIPFDVRHHRVIIYSFTPRGMRDFESALTRALSLV